MDYEVVFETSPLNIKPFVLFNVDPILRSDYTL